MNAPFIKRPFSGFLAFLSQMPYFLRRPCSKRDLMWPIMGFLVFLSQMPSFLRRSCSESDYNGFSQKGIVGRKPSKVLTCKLNTAYAMATK